VRSTYPFVLKKLLGINTRNNSKTPTTHSVFAAFCKVWASTFSLANIKTSRSTGTLATCGTCKQYETRLQKIRKDNEAERAKVKLEFEGHILLQRYERESYFHKRLLATTRPNQYLSCILDSTTQAGYMCPNTGSYNKGHDASDCLPQSITAAIFHGAATYLFPSTNFLPSKGANWTIQCLSTALDRLRTLPQYETTGLPKTLFLQLDNCSGENKNKYVFSFLSELVHNGTFDSIVVSFLPVGHTHEDIDQMFSVIAKALDKGCFSLTLDQFDAQLISILKTNDKKYGEPEVIRLRGVGDFKALLEQHIDPKFKGHKQPHCFAFEAEIVHGFRRSTMRYREYSLSRKWFPQALLVNGILSVEDVYAGAAVNADGCPVAADENEDLTQLALLEASVMADNELHEQIEGQQPSKKARKSEGPSNEEKDATTTSVPFTRIDVESSLYIGRGWLSHENAESRKSFQQSPGLCINLTHPDFSALTIAQPKASPAEEVQDIRNKVMSYVRNSGLYSHVTEDMIAPALQFWEDYFTRTWAYSIEELSLNDIFVDWRKLFRQDNQGDGEDDPRENDELTMPVTSTTANEVIRQYSSLQFKGGEPIGHTGMAARAKKRGEIQELNKIHDLPINSKDFLICIRPSDDVRFTGEGFSKKEESLRFYLAKAEEDCPADAPEGTEIAVTYWRQPDGDPNGIFIEGTENIPGEKNAPWQGIVLKKSVLLISPSFSKSHRAHKTLRKKHSKLLQSCITPNCKAGCTRLEPGWCTGRQQLTAKLWLVSSSWCR